MAQSGTSNAAFEFTAPFSLSTPDGDISPRRLSLLAAIGRTGSISAAARDVGITYKAAWDAVDAMNNMAGEVLVVSQHGGKGGGGAALTAAGQKSWMIWAVCNACRRSFWRSSRPRAIWTNRWRR